MAEWINTDLGPIRSLGTHPTYGRVWLLELPCGDYELMNTEQFEGRVSVDHSRVCKRGNAYHETHDFRAAYEKASGEGERE